MTTIDPTTSGSTTSGTTGSSSSQALNSLSNPQMFLQLLIAELQNQDPTDPTDPSTIMQQTAELSQVQAVNTMTTAITSEQTAAQDDQADGLIGHSITGTVNGNPISGTVSEVQLSSTGAPTLVVNGTTIPLSSISTVS